MTQVCSGLCFSPLSVILFILQGIVQARSGGWTQPYPPVTAISSPACAVCSCKIGQGQMWGHLVFSGVPSPLTVPVKWTNAHRAAAVTNPRCANQSPCPGTGTWTGSVSAGLYHDTSALELRKTARRLGRAETWTRGTWVIPVNHGAFPYTQVGPSRFS